MNTYIENKAQILPKNRTPQNFTDAATNFQKSETEDAKNSRKRAWIITFIALFIAALTTTAFLIATYRRTEPEPTIIMVDKSTGASTVLRSVKDTFDHYDDVVNKYWLAQYVQQRESYNWYTISAQVDAVRLMSDPAIGDGYAIAVQSDNSPLKLLKDKANIVAKVSSISFVDHTALVRYTVEKQNLNGVNPEGTFVQKWIATVTFKFDAGMMTEQQRYVNELGFKVLSYRTDPEVIK